MDIYLITGNLNKFREFEKFFGAKINHLKLDLDELQSMDTDQISEHKARQAFDKVQKPVIVLDQSLSISCLNGFPGPLVKWFWETVTLEKICQIVSLYKDRRVTTKNTLTFFDGKLMKHFYAEGHGVVSRQPQGKYGFGWDAIFIPNGEEETNAQMPPSNLRYHEIYRSVVEQFKAFLKQTGYNLTNESH